MIVAPVNWMKGMAESSATAMHDQNGVWNVGLTLASGFESGSCSSRAMPKARRTVEVMIDMQQMKMAADTIRRYTVEKPFDSTSSMMFCGPVKLVIAF